MLPAALPDVSGIKNANELGHILYDEKRAGGVGWCRLGGLSVDSGSDHLGALRFLKDLGFGGDGPKLRPHTVVLDWSAATMCAADGLAFFSVLVRALEEAGFAIIVCEPSDGDLARALERSGLRHTHGNVVWIPCSRSRPGSAEAMAPAAVFGGTIGRGNVGQVFRDLDDALDHAGVEDRQACLLSAVATDLVQNVVAHSGGAPAAAVAVLRTRCRPRVIEFGIADGGVGIATHLLSQERYGWLLPFTDATVTATVFAQALSGRAADAGGGGLSRLIRRLRDDCGATVVIRSGAGLISLAGPSSSRCTSNRLSCGWGTQTLVTFRLRA
ncbi:MAG TPA: hypothetical protein VE913_12945 [Longimicrobium sp.]|nr:hypothetical protein [Longimicrobium sp.]